VKQLLVLALLASSELWAAACCGGGSAKSFISLQRLQTYEVGLSSTFRDVYGEYDTYGELGEVSRNQTLSLLFGGGMRVTQDLQVAVTLPLVHQQNLYSRQGLGDAVFSAQYTALESLFIDDWYPTLNLFAGVKTPTGSQETLRDGRAYPGTGNGVWEPYFGVQASKTYGSFILLARAGYTARLLHDGNDKGDGIDLAESITLVVLPELSLAFGSTQSWNFDDRIGGGIRADSASRGVTFFFAPTYFLNRYWSVAGGFEASPNWNRFGVNQPAFQSVTLTTRYGFY